MKASEVKVGERILIRESGFSRTIREVVVIEISPSKKRIKLQYPSGHIGWENEDEIGNMILVEKLPEPPKEGENS